MKPVAVRLAAPGWRLFLQRGPETLRTGDLAWSAALFSMAGDAMAAWHYQTSAEETVKKATEFVRDQDEVAARALVERWKEVRDTWANA